MASLSERHFRLKNPQWKPDVTSWLTRWRTDVQTGYRTECVRRLHVKRVAQCHLVEGVPNEGDIAYKQQVVRYTHQPYTFRYIHPTDTIKGIACIPVNEETHSPEAVVIEGGINYNHATICLTPVWKALGGVTLPPVQNRAQARWLWR